MKCDICRTMSKNLSIAPPDSACSISSCDNNWTNHSKERWSRLIQKKSTLRRFMTVGGISDAQVYVQCGQVWRAEIILIGILNFLMKRDKTFVVTVHNWLQNRSKWCNTNASSDQHSMLSTENVTGRSSIRSIDEDLKNYQVEWPQMKQTFIIPRVVVRQES